MKNTPKIQSNLLPPQRLETARVAPDATSPSHRHGRKMSAKEANAQGDGHLHKDPNNPNASQATLHRQGKRVVVTLSLKNIQGVLLPLMQRERFRVTGHSPDETTLTLTRTHRSTDEALTQHQRLARQPLPKAVVSSQN